MNEFIFLASDGFTDLDPMFFLGWFATLGVFVGLLIALHEIYSRLRGKKHTQVHVNPSPVPIRQTFEGPTRQEFEELKIEVKAIEKGQHDMERRILAAIKEDARATREMVDRIADKAYQGRKELHNKLNRQGERIAELDARTQKS